MVYLFRRPLQCITLIWEGSRQVSVVYLFRRPLQCTNAGREMFVINVSVVYLFRRPLQSCAWHAINTLLFQWCIYSAGHFNFIASILISLKFQWCIYSAGHFNKIGKIEKIIESFSGVSIPQATSMERWVLGCT